MIVDVHTHVFPPEVVRARDDYLRRDPTFAELYRRPSAALATAEELLAALDEAGVDRAVALGFAWTDPELCRRHNDYLLEWAARSGGRLIPFCTVQPAASWDETRREAERCAAAGARGLGELRPANQGYDLAGSDAAGHLAQAARDHGLILLFHVSEPVGHRYPGKGGLDLGAFYDFAAANRDLTVVGAHWAGGLPFYSLMPEVKDLFNSVYVDTAASHLLYRDQAYQEGVRLIGAERILFGSDFPLTTPARARSRVEAAPLTAADKRKILGENAARLLGLA
ncbi:MAG TPA: amidohydrolase family protein [Dehalococcoidia bacterium]